MNAAEIKEWVELRAEQWVEWRIRNRERSAGYGDSSMSNLDQAPSGARDSGSWQWLVCDDENCMRFEAAFTALEEPLRVVATMHWLGSDVWQLPASGPVEEKAGRCGLSVRRYHRLLERVREELFAGLHNYLSTAG